MAKNPEKLGPSPTSPAKLTGLKTTEPKKVAAGIPAVISSAKHIFGEMGLGRGLKALANLNQKGGIDCPGCAWPDPDDERSTIAEYCENGAKAIAEEATTKKLDANFFKKNPSVKNRHLTYGLNGGDKCSWTPMQEVNGPMSGEEWCQHRIQIWGGVALASRIDKIIGLFCKRALLKRRYSAKETYNFIDPTNCSHPISTTIHRFIDQSICHGIEGRSRST